MDHQDKGNKAVEVTAANYNRDITLGHHLLILGLQ